MPDKTWHLPSEKPTEDKTYLVKFKDNSLKAAYYSTEDDIWTDVDAHFWGSFPDYLSAITIVEWCEIN